MTVRVGLVVGTVGLLMLTMHGRAQSSSVFFGPSAPMSCPEPNAVWVDTSQSPPLFKYCSNQSTQTWTAFNGQDGGTGEGVPAGSILFVISGSCPTGYEEETGLNGKTLIGTLAANANIGTTGGADTITPAGINTLGAVSAHAGTAVADHASHTHTYTDVIAHTHTLPVGATDDTSAPFDRADAGTNASGANATTASGSTGVATGTTAGPNATLTHSVTQPSAHVFTNPVFGGTQFDNRSAFVRLIGCRKT